MTLRNEFPQNQPDEHAAQLGGSYAVPGPGQSQQNQSHSGYPSLPPKGQVADSTNYSPVHCPAERGWELGGC